jgi:phosphate/sulfate permease
MIIDVISSAIISGLVVSLLAGIIISLLRRRWHNIDKKEKLYKDRDDELADILKSIWRLNKTVLIMAKIIDDQTEKAHGDLNSSLEDIATELLSESDKS